MEDEPSWRIQSVERTAAILNLFDAERLAWSEQDIVSATGLSRGTVYRQCQTLRHLGYLVADSSGRYRLGLRALTLGQVALLGFDVAALASPPLTELRDHTGHTVNLTALDGEDIVFLVRLRGSSLLDIRMEVGSRLPAYCTSMGRAMLSCLPDADLDEFLRSAKLEARTPLTVTDPDVLREKIRFVREKGYAVNDGELETGLSGVAAPIRFADGRPAAAVNIALTQPIAQSDLTHTLAPLVVACAQKVTAILAGQAT